MYIKHILFSHCVKNIYYFTVSFFNLFISLILALKHSIVGFLKEYLLLFNFTIVTLIFGLLHVKNSGLLLMSITNKSICGLSFSN